MISNNTAYIILEWLVYISVILMALACIAFILNDIPYLFCVMWIPCYIILLGVGLEIYTENWK